MIDRDDTFPEIKLGSADLPGVRVVRQRGLSQEPGGIRSAVPRAASACCYGVRLVVISVSMDSRFRDAAGMRRRVDWRPDALAACQPHFFLSLNSRDFPHRPSAALRVRTYTYSAFGCSTKPHFATMLEMVPRNLDPQNACSFFVIHDYSLEQDEWLNQNKKLSVSCGCSADVYTASHMILVLPGEFCLTRLVCRPRLHES